MSIVKDFLRQKDSDYSKFIPPAYNLSPEEKLRLLYLQTSRTKFEIRAVARCIKPCFHNFQTPVVSESESECMINCAAKNLESLAELQL